MRSALSYKAIYGCIHVYHVHKYINNDLKIDRRHMHAKVYLPCDVRDRFVVVHGPSRNTVRTCGRAAHDL
jgi:hypothetical protein